MSNVFTRTISGVIFLLIVTGALLSGAYYTLGLFSIMTGIMSWEYLRITLPGKISLPGILSVSASILIYAIPFLISHLELSYKLLFIIVIPIAAIYISLLYTKKSQTVEYRYHPFLLAPLLYIALPFSLTTAILFRTAGQFNPGLLLSLLIITWVSDVGAYVAGISFGQKNGHKLFPSISPKKSWEGFAGGLLLAIVSAFVLTHFNLINSGLTHSIIISVIVNIGGVLGDLVESQLKREFVVKDSGTIMPGHGGLLDRFDGTLISFPLAISYILIFNIT